MQRERTEACHALVDLSRYNDTGIWMRIEDTSLKPEEAEEVTSKMFELADPYIVWDFPDRATHLAQSKYETDPRDLERQPDQETKEQYEERMVRLRNAPDTISRCEEGWLRRACIINGVLGLLHNAAKGDYSVLKTKHTSFFPKLYYDYFWICLRLGFGVRAWGAAEPPKPPYEWGPEDLGHWYWQTADRTLHGALYRWHGGELLEDIAGYSLIARKVLRGPSDEVVR